MACFEFVGPDTDSTSDSTVNALSLQIEDAMRVFENEPVVYWWQVHRRLSKKWPSGSFQTKAAQKLDQISHDMLGANPQYENRHYLSILLLPPTGSDSVQQKLAAVVRSGDRIDKAFLAALKIAAASFLPGKATVSYQFQAGDAERAAARFEVLLSNFLANISYLNVQRLTNDRLRGFLVRSCSFATTGGDFPFPEEQDLCYKFLDDSLYTNDLTLDPESEETLVWKSWQTEDPREPVYSQVQSVNKWQASARDTDGGIINGTWPGIVDALLQIDGELVITTCIKPMLPAAAESFSQSARKFHNDRLLGIKSLLLGAFNREKLDTAPVNTARARAAQEANEVHGLVSMGQMQIAHSWMSVQSIAVDRNSVQTLTKRVEQVLTQAKFGAKLESLHALSCTAASFPGNYRPIVRWIPITAQNAADTVLARSIVSGSLYSEHLTKQLGTHCDAALVLPTSYRTAFFYDVFAPMVGHCLLVGPSRAGKTVFAMRVASGFTRYPGAQVFCLDKDYSCRLFVTTHGGKYVNLNPESNSQQGAISINPFVLLSNSAHHEWLVNFTILLATQRQYVVDSADVRDIEQAIAVTARLDPGDHNLTGVYGHITRAKLREELRVWIRAENGTLAKYFDNETDSFSLSQVSGFELGKILENKQVAQPFTEMLFYRIDQHLLDQIENGIVTPTMIFIPEVWNLISHPAYANKLKDWLKTLAKRNCALWMDTQSLEDSISSDEVKGLFPALRDNIKNMVFVPNDKALTDSAAKFYKGEFNLQDEQLTLIARGRPRRDYLIRQEIGDQEVYRMVHLSLSAQELAFLRSDTPAQICLNKYLARDQPVDLWLDEFIAEMSAPIAPQSTSKGTKK